VNSRLDALQAGLLSLRLGKLDEWNLQRSAAASYYTEQLAGIGDLVVPFTEDYSTHIYHLYILKTNKAVSLQEHLGNHQIGAALYYPISLHEQECFNHLPGFVKPSLPVAEDCAGRTIAIPCYPGITRKQQDEVIASIQDFFS
jgi:dTDP-4-amino-4,6-dideoxygalactose transaminase